MLEIIYVEVLKGSKELHKRQYKLLSINITNNSKFLKAEWIHRFFKVQRYAK